ncbi:phage tail tube protein [Paraburkholderia caballeronis]|uniref:Phage tail tube protein n=1 Tax=Paraburkholderia caballeronis TaxID=416943 RepID=A0A1H7TYI1_9BURK|nr:phage tail tube protein [Paraburkholderia caballeronis]PXW23409.1 tail tube protein [Paraburkholderia caballeronis]PXW98402.1 tail tube protein [Paraburkholderia caballeronis]RAJ95133.1 tail tube protein [Paraburkholderia caballeronis]SEC55170.1 Phage tail tube protein [Paraburkholderia caballeronis]SEL89932.1 Phage tail tube protein [Paraburkholderia caballeronis]
MPAPQGLLAGTASLSIDGTTYLITADFKYKPANRRRESLSGMDTVHGYKETISPPFISFNLRDWGGLTVADINTMTNVTVVAQLANGKTIIGRNMWTVEEQEVDSNDAKFDVRLEGPEGCVTETTAS